MWDRPAAAWWWERRQEAVRGEDEHLNGFLSTSTLPNHICNCLGPTSEKIV